MQYAGKKLRRHEKDVIVIPRGEENIIIHVQCVADYSPFEAMCPEPQPPMRTKPGEDPFPLYDAPEYKQKMNEWSERRSAWMILQSLRATEDIQWEKVKSDDPSTWELYKEELQECFSEVEMMLILNKIIDVCGLNTQKIEAATADFVHTASQTVK